MEWLDWLQEGWRHSVAVLTIVVALIASVHAVIRKREPRSATLWIVVIWLMPLVGSLLYVLLGVNRIERRATALRREDDRSQPTSADGTCAAVGEVEDQCAEALRPLAQLVRNLVSRPLTRGNDIEALIDGGATYPAMLQAIEAAQSSIVLSTYIFEKGGIGAQFVDALARASKRGVEVRVLLDDAYARYSRKSARRALRRAGVPVAVFNPALLPGRFLYANLRNHSKIMVVDGEFGFTGGINIHNRYWSSEPEAMCNRDLHFRLRGPVVAHLMEVVAADWQFATGEDLEGESWSVSGGAAGAMVARGIEAGPDESFERLRRTIHGALAVARSSVHIVTPYFLPDSALISALNVAAMRGVDVEIILPERSDHAVVQWAMNAQLWQVLEGGCRVWLTPGSFDHSKLMVIDGAWSMFGSTNWDPRSLRLNFEFNVECYSEEFGQGLEAIFAEKRGRARETSLAEMDGRPGPVQLRDGVARLFSPFL